MSANRVLRSIGRVSAGCAAAFALAVISCRLHLNLSTVISIHLSLIAFLALRWELLEAGLVSVICVGCLDYFFTAPLFHFDIGDSHDRASLFVFEIISLSLSLIFIQLGRRTRDLERRGRQQQMLYELSQHILLLKKEHLTNQRIAELISRTLLIEGVVIWSIYGVDMYKNGIAKISEEELREACFNEVNHKGDDDHASARVLRSGALPVGSLFLYGHALDISTVNAVADLCSVAIECVRSSWIETSSETAKQSERFCSTILDGLAHAFKTPLTSMRTSSSGLLAMNTLSDNEERLVGLIDRHTSHLSELTTDLLMMVRLESDLRLKCENVDLEQLLRDTVADANLQLQGHHVDLHIESRNIAVYADRRLLRMALLQILDNAAKYSTPNSPVVVGLRDEEAESFILIANEGSFIPHKEQQKIFERFYRCSNSAKEISGAGLGLSIVKRITDAHQGRIWVNSDLITGTSFALALPRITGQRAQNLGDRESCRAL